MKALLSIACLTLLGLAQPVLAQDARSAEAESEVAPEAANEETSEAPTAPATSDEAASFARRLELAKKMHDFRPAAEQVDNAIDSVSKRLPGTEAETFKANMRNLLNYRSIEQISINAMAQTYTEEELAAMVEYYSKPEAQSASKKFQVYQDKVTPDIVRMIDQAVMKLRTGGAGK